MKRPARKPVTAAMVTKWFLREIFAGKNQYIVGTTCSICGDLLQPGQRIDWDHIHPVGLKGPHEVGNLRPLHHDCHKKKTKRDVQAMAKADRSNGTTGTRGEKFAVNKLPLDVERPDKPSRFGFRVKVKMR